MDIILSITLALTLNLVKDEVGIVFILKLSHVIFHLPMQYAGTLTNDLDIIENVYV